MLVACGGEIMNKKQKVSQKESYVGLFVLLGFFAVGFAVLAVMVVYKLGVFEPISKDKLYGRWVELGVPSYARDRFTISADGIYADGRLKSTTFEFDGDILTYEHSGTKYVYHIERKDGSRLLRVKPTHYSSSFQKM